jgi:hypothetical protein
MAFYTKKPVTIEARQFDGTLECTQALYEWVESCNPGSSDTFKIQTELA